MNNLCYRHLICAASLYFELSKKILVLLKISNTHFLNPGPATGWRQCLTTCAACNPPVSRSTGLFYDYCCSIPFIEPLVVASWGCRLIVGIFYTVSDRNRSRLNMWLCYYTRYLLIHFHCQLTSLDREFCSIFNHTFG